MSTTARAISDYLLTGMHHATPEGQAAIEAILAEHGRRNAQAVRQAVGHLPARYHLSP